MMDRGNDSGAILETRIDIEVINDNKEKILPESTCKNEKNGEEKMSTEQEQMSTEQEQTISISTKNDNDPSLASSKETLDNQPHKGVPPAKLFGLRYYLHHLYESVSALDSQQEDMPPSETMPSRPMKDMPPGEATPSHPMKDTSNCPCCKTWKSFSLTLMVIGLMIAAIGFIIPFYCIISREDRNKVTSSEMRIHEKTILCRLIGVLIFCIGIVIYMVKKRGDEEEPTSGDSTNLYLSMETNDGTNEKSAGALEMTTIQPKIDSKDFVVDKNEVMAPQPMAVLQVEVKK